MSSLILVKRSSSKLKTKIKSILFDLDGVFWLNISLVAAQFLELVHFLGPLASWFVLRDSDNYP